MTDAMGILVSVGAGCLYLILGVISFVYLCGCFCVSKLHWNHTSIVLIFIYVCMSINCFLRIFQHLFLRSSCPKDVVTSVDSFCDLSGVFTVSTIDMFLNLFSTAFSFASYFSIAYFWGERYNTLVSVSWNSEKAKKLLKFTFNFIFGSVLVVLFLVVCIVCAIIGLNPIIKPESLFFQITLTSIRVITCLVISGVVLFYGYQTILFFQKTGTPHKAENYLRVGFLSISVGIVYMIVSCLNIFTFCAYILFDYHVYHRQVWYHLVSLAKSSLDQLTIVAVLLVLVPPSISYLYDKFKARLVSSLTADSKQRNVHNDLLKLDEFDAFETISS